MNAHEWAKRQALAAGLAFTEPSNGFASAGDPATRRPGDSAALQAACDRFGPQDAQDWFDRWTAMDLGRPAGHPAGNYPCI